ncbi:hypothetical protein L1887_38622 [Cichorium endivia]|nr:hypothetical protein L1887_38622 [Cichorium endivia]
MLLLLLPTLLLKKLINGGGNFSVLPGLDMGFLDFIIFTITHRLYMEIDVVENLITENLMCENMINRLVKNSLVSRKSIWMADTVIDGDMGGVTLPINCVICVSGDVITTEVEDRIDVV